LRNKAIDAIKKGIAAGINGAIQGAALGYIFGSNIAGDNFDAGIAGASAGAIYGFTASFFGAVADEIWDIKGFVAAQLGVKVHNLSSKGFINGLTAIIVKAISKECGLDFEGSAPVNSAVLGALIGATSGAFSSGGDAGDIFEGAIVGGAAGYLGGVLEEELLKQLNYGK